MLAVPDGGFTYDGERGEMVTSGFAVGMSHSVPSLTMDADKFLSNPRAGKKMIADHLEAVGKTGNPDIKAGGWHNPDTGIIALDAAKEVTRHVLGERLRPEVVEANVRALQRAYDECVEG